MLSGEPFHIKGHKIYQIYTNNYLIAGDLSAPNYNTHGKETIYRDNDGKEGFFIKTFIKLKNFIFIIKINF